MLIRTIATVGIPSLFACGATQTLAPRCTGPVPAARGFSTAGSLRVARALHTVTRLQDGRLLVVGGGTPETPVRSAEVHDLTTGCSIVLPLTSPRLGHTATLLEDGRVMIAGGGYGNSPSTTSAEIFDPTTNSLGGSLALTTPRSDHAAIRLADGRVMLVGGDASGVGSSPTARTEIYDPAVGRFIAAPDMRNARRPYRVVLLNDGRVLAAGGTTSNRTVTAAAELFDPGTNRWESVGGMSEAREKFTAAVLADGRVLVAGGSRNDTRLATSELFDPQTLRFSPGPAMTISRHKVTSARATGGDVIIVGGGNSLMERFDVAAMKFQLIADVPRVERLFASAVGLPDGAVFVSGGYAAGGASAAAWIWRP